MCSKDRSEKLSAKKGKPTLKWVVKFTFKEDFTNSLVDLKGTDLFNKKYPVFKIVLAEELLNSNIPHYFYIKRSEQETDIKDPTGKTVPLGSCIYIMGLSKDLGICNMLFFPQPEEFDEEERPIGGPQRLVLVGLDEVWIKVLEQIEESQRLTTITNVAASFVTTPDIWSQVYIIY